MKNEHQFGMLDMSTGCYLFISRTYRSVVPCIERTLPTANNPNDWFLSLVFNKSRAYDLSMSMCRRFPSKYGFPLYIKWATSWQNQQNDCVPNEDRSAWASAQSDQSSLCAQWVATRTSLLHADSEDSDQTGWMPRLIWVFAGCTCHLVGFIMRQLK